MDEHEWLAARFEENRSHLLAVAHRLLGSLAEADDAVQEAWVRMQRSGAGGVDNLVGWMTTIVGRVCLNMLQSRKSRREELVGGYDAESIAGKDGGADPAQEAQIADSVGIALLVVLDNLAPAERLAFVLHDLFAVPFDEIAPIVERSPAAARQLASRARRRVQGAPAAGGADHAAKRELVDAFLAASRNGDFDALLAMLDPDVTLRADDTVVRMGGSSQVDGAWAVANTFCGRAQGARPALVDGAPGAVWAPGGRPKVVFIFVIDGGKIVEMEQLGDPTVLGQLDLETLHT